MSRSYARDVDPAGSAWAEYKKSGTVHGISMPSGLVESQKLPKPMFTPSTKAEAGEHDENIHPDKGALYAILLPAHSAVKDICGPELASEIERVAIQLYSASSGVSGLKSCAEIIAEAAAYALERGLILADTKFEFGLLPPSATHSTVSSRLTLIDEALTPDSSRYWSAADYVPGRPQPSFDKQYLRDWLIQNDLRDTKGVTLPAEVIQQTRAKYDEAKERIMGLGQYGVHGRKDLKADGQALQTDQAADAISTAAARGEKHGRSDLAGDELALQTDQAADAIASAVSKV